jgi:5-methyltetrahydropteroyltriglutamate--homocysteine methyltransferase
VHDAPLADYVDTLFTIQPGAFSFEAANPRHEHVYHAFESVKPPPDAVLLPGVISHATSIVEHPGTIADRIVRFAGLVGRENVVASADCGFSSQATYTRRFTRRSCGPSSSRWPRAPAGPPPGSGPSSG